MPVPDKLERKMVFKASRDKVWDAVTKPDMISKWFANSIDVTSFQVGQEFTFDWAGEGLGYARAIIETIDPKSRFAYRWENEGVDQTKPLAEVPKTLVTFLLADVDGGTELTVIETGFLSLPTPKVNFDTNSTGWDTELNELQAFLETETA